MGMARKQPFDIMREVKARPAMSVIERIATESIRQIAMEGREATQPELCAATGVTYQAGTLPAILARLVKKGYVIRKSYQRGLHLGLVLGDGSVLWTAEPRDKTPHWRYRTEAVPTPAIQSVREKLQTTTMQIEADAQKLGKSLADHLADLVYIGHHAFRAEQEI